MQIAKIRLDLIEKAPRPFPLRREQPTSVLKTAMGASGDGAQDVEITQQRLGGRGIGTHGRPRRVIGHAQHEEGVGQHQIAGGARPREVDLIESPDLPGAEPMRRD